MYANRYVCTLTIRCSDINHSPFVYPFHRDIGNFVCFAFPFLLAFRPVLRQQNHWSASLDVGSHVVKKPRARRIFRFDFNHLNRSMINHRFGFQMIATNDDDDDESFEIGSQSIWCQIGIPTLSIFVIESLYFVASILLLRLGLRQKTVNLSGRFRRARCRIHQIQVLWCYPSYKRSFYDSITTSYLHTWLTTDIFNRISESHPATQRNIGKCLISKTQVEAKVCLRRETNRRSSFSMINEDDVHHSSYIFLGCRYL